MDDENKNLQDKRKLFRKILLSTLLFEFFSENLVLPSLLYSPPVIFVMYNKVHH